MQRDRADRNEFFHMNDPFSNFRAFGSMPSLFGGRDPFDDPFFTRPFGGMFESGIRTPSPATFDAPDPNRGNNVVIEELTSDDEGGKEDSQTGGENKNNNNSQMYIEHPDGDSNERTSLSVNHRNNYNRTRGTEPQARSFNSQTCKVTYGGVDGAYYTSTRTRKAGSDGVVIEENREADKTTGQATHRISRGINEKGHSFSRKLNSDGKVDTMQTLHNLNEDELGGFEEAWKGRNREQLPGRGDKFGSSSNRMENWGSRPFPSTERIRNAGGQGSDMTNSSGARTKKVVRINID